MKDSLKKYQEITKYMLFGVITTVVAMGIYFLTLWIGEAAFKIDSNSTEFYSVRTIAQLLQWAGAVILSFYTNKVFVFKVESKKKHQTFIEFSKFALSRVATLGLDTAITFGTVELLKVLNYQDFKLIISFTKDVWSKIISGFVVIVTNYIISKMIVFKNKKER